jgi:hypothetical protein
MFEIRIDLSMPIQGSTRCNNGVETTSIMHGAAIIQLIVTPEKLSRVMISGINIGIRRKPILKKNVVKQKIFIALSDAT